MMDDIWSLLKRKMGPGVRQAPSSVPECQPAGSSQAATTVLRRRAAKPTKPKPSSSSAQLDGSGTTVGVGGMMMVAGSVVATAKARSITMSFDAPPRFELNTKAVV